MMPRSYRSFLPSALFALLILVLATTDAAAQTCGGYCNWYLAEGAQNTFFDEEILIANPTGEEAHVTVTLLPEPGAGSQTQRSFRVGAHSRHTLALAQFFPDRINGAVSARIRSTNGVPIVVERSMYWPNGIRNAGHNAVGLTKLSETWHLAEGASGFWENFILLVNPNDVEATVELTFLPAAGGVARSMTRRLPPRSRNTVWVNGQADVPSEFYNAEFSTTITADVPIAVERAMYWDNFAGGTDSTAAVTPAETWHFGEGATSRNAVLQFETFLLLQNPNPEETTVDVTFFKDGGGAVEQAYVVPGGTRRTVSARLHVPGLGETGFSMTAQSRDPNLPIVAERAMYWLLNGRTIPAEGHTVQGVSELASAWAFADGIQGQVTGVVGGPYDTFFLVSNPHPEPLDLDVTVVREDGSGEVRRHTVPAQARYTLYMGLADASGTPHYPEASNQRFATFIRSTNGQEFLAERAVYWGNLNGGHASAGVPWPWEGEDARAFATPGAILAPQVTTIGPEEGRLRGGTPITIRGRGFQQGATLSIGGVPARAVRVVNDTTIRAITPARATLRSGPVTVRVTNADGREGTSRFTYMLRVLAFGDSITHGTTTICSGGACTGGVAQRPYPRMLEARLAEHPAFAEGVVVVNEGVPSECASQANGCAFGAGEARLPDILDDSTNDYDFMVLLEGINDLVGQDPSARAPNARNGLRAMVRDARAHGIEPILCHLTPVEPDRRDPEAVALLNDLIWDLTNQEGLFRVQWNGVALSPDGLHPNQAGYNAMAQQVYQKILDIRNAQN